MAQRKNSASQPGPGRRIWRITQDAPLGEYVDPDQIAQEAAAQRPLIERPDPPGWQASSFDLSRGLEVSDETDTIPGDLFDELFRKS